MCLLSTKQHSKPVVLNAGFVTPVVSGPTLSQGLPKTTGKHTYFH